MRIINGDIRSFDYGSYSVARHMVQLKLHEVWCKNLVYAASTWFRIRGFRV